MDYWLPLWQRYLWFTAWHQCYTAQVGRNSLHLRRPRSLENTVTPLIDKSVNVLNFKHSNEQTATEQARYYGAYRICELKDKSTSTRLHKICTRVMLFRKPLGYLIMHV